jgi:hypothetical protein
MALSLESIYRPFNEFFVQKFAASEGKSVTFRFAYLARAFEDSDFLIPNQPNLGPQQTVADELFSTVVDSVPLLDADGRTVSLQSASHLSDVYHDEILGPAIPCVPAGVTDAAERQARIDAFNAAKTDALGLWEKNKAASLLEGPGVQFRPSTAMPRNWWDKTAAVWTHQSFQVKGAATVPGQPQQPPDQILRMKVHDNVMRSVLQAHILESHSVAPAPGQPAVKLSPLTMIMARPIFTTALAADSARAKVIGATPAIKREVMVDGAPPAVAIHDDVTQKIATFRFKQRLEFEAILAENAQRQPVTTNDVTISFDYCVVNVERRWFHYAFINDPSWCIPGQGKGHLSANDGHGLPALTTGFVAVKGLSIQAPWTPEDITNLELSVQFGPFNFDSKVVNGAISHAGVQIVGWSLQNNPDLAPNAA